MLSLFPVNFYSILSFEYFESLSELIAFNDVGVRFQTESSDRLKSYANRCHIIVILFVGCHILNTVNVCLVL